MGCGLLWDVSAAVGFGGCVGIKRFLVLTIRYLKLLLSEKLV